MNWRTGLGRGRSHIIMALALAAAGLFLIRLDEKQLANRPGATHPAPDCASCVSKVP